jgi:hypothetical protein
MRPSLAHLTFALAPKRNQGQILSVSISKIAQWLSILIPLSLYLWLALPHLSLPGLHNDEAQEAGLQAYQLASGQPVTLFRGIGLAGLPIMVQDYIGALNVYLVLPFVRQFGPNAVSVRLPFVAVATLTLLLFFAWIRQQWGFRSAWIATLLLAVHPGFVFWSRQGVLVAFLTLPLCIALGWLWQTVLQTPASQQKSWVWFLLGLLCGVGLYTKLLFIWTINGLFGTWFIINLAKWVLRRTDWQIRDVRGWLVKLLWGTVGSFLGLLPLLYYNMQSGGTLLSFQGNLSHSYYGVNNANWLANLTTRFQQIRAVLASREYFYLFGEQTSNLLWEPTLVVALGFIAFASLQKFRKRDQAWQSGMFLLLAFSLTFLQSIFTVSDLFHHHLAMLLPWLVCLVAVGLDSLQKFLPKGKFAQWVSVLPVGVCLLLAGRDVQVSRHYLQELQKSGGLGTLSDAIYRLASEMERFPSGTPLVALDWGISQPLRYLTAEQMQPAELFGYSWEVDAGFATRLEPYLQNPNSVYILHWEQETIFPGRREALQALADAHHLQVVSVTSVGRGDGAPYYEVWMLPPKEK